MKKTDPERLLTVGEVADKLNVCRNWVYTHSLPSSRLKIPAVRLGGALRFHPDDIEKFIQRCKRQMAAGEPLQ